VNDFKSLGTQPISDAAPCGADVRDDPDFELLQNEIAKLTNPAASGSPDWSFFAAAKKVTAAPHRGNANKPT
jgi:type VI secretion system protein VasJ